MFQVSFHWEATCEENEADFVVPFIIVNIVPLKIMNEKATYTTQKKSTGQV